MDPRETLTAAQGQSGLLLVPLSSHRTDSNVRHIPYAETYRGFSALLKTPVERMQEVADEQSEDSPAP
jgi:hypothetical protein